MRERKSLYALVLRNDTVGPFNLQHVLGQLENLRVAFTVLIVSPDYLATLDTPRARSCEFSIPRVFHVSKISVICAVGDARCRIDAGVIPFANEF